MSKSGNVTDTEEQIAGSQHEGRDLQSELHSVADAPRLKETTEVRQVSQTDLQGKLDDPPEGPRPSEHACNPTEKMRALQVEEAKKREKRLLSMYEEWKLSVPKARDQLKSYMPESELCPLIEELKKGKEDIMNIYFEIRDLATPSTDVRRRVDTCESVTTEIIIIAHSRVIDNEGEFNEDQERKKP